MADIYTSKREREVLDDSDDLLASFHETPSDAQKFKGDAEDTGAGKRWTPEQDEALRKAAEEFGQRNWKSIAARVPGRNHAQCLQRWNKVLKPGLVKGHWSYEEDSILERMVLQGCHSWAEVAAHIAGRTAKQCRERWRNHLDPSINKSPFTPEEDVIIQQAYESLGNRWTQIAELLPGRTEDAVKLRWKALNPNQRTNAKPGRPRLMPGMNVNKPRSAAPPTPDDVATTLMATPVSIPDLNENMGLHPNSYASAPYAVGDYPTAPYSADNSIAAPMNKSMIRPPIHHSSVPSNSTNHTGGNSHIPSELPEPIVEPLGDESKEELDLKDAEILKELLRSHSKSLLSFGSTRELSSFADISPEDLLASGELDEMLGAISLANRPSGSSSFRSSSLKLTGSRSKMDSFKKAVQNMGREEKHLFQGLIDELRRAEAGGTGPGSGQSVGNGDQQSILDLPVDTNPYTTSFSSSSGRNLLHSLEFKEEVPRRAVKGGISPDVGDITNDIDDLLDPSLMRPIRRGVQY